MAWTFVGVSAAASATGTPITLAEPAGVADGDLLIACISSRTTSTTSITNTGWTLVNEQKTNNILTTTSAVASGCMLYRVRSGAPDLTFTLPASGTSIAFGRLIAYRGNAATTPLDASTAVTTAIDTTAVSVAGLTTTQANDLIVAMTCGGQEAAWSAFNNATTPIGASGATDTSTAPSTTAWIERADSSTTTGTDTSLAIFDAVRTAAGATGNLTATASLGAGHVVIAGAFKIFVPGTADAWNVNDKSSITLSNGDKTATATSSAGIRSTTTHPNETAGKFYAEFLLENVTGGLICVGIHNLTASLILTNGASCHVRTDNGNIYINNSVVQNLASSLVDDDVVSIAWDSGAERIWFRLNGGLWNTSSIGDPTTGVAGFNCSFAAAVGHALWFADNAGGHAVTVRTEAADFTYSGPSGFTSWMGETIDTGISGTLVTTEAIDSADLAGATEPVTGTFAVTETADAANLAAAVRWLGDLAAAEATDTTNVSAAVHWLATFAAPELPDTANINAAIIATGTLAATDGADAANITGGIVATGTLTAAELPDVALINAAIIGTGTFAVTEAADAASITGQIVGAGIGAVLAATEAADQALVGGQVTGVVGTFVASEASDTAALAAAVRWLAQFTGQEAPDTANLAATIRWLATLQATEAADVAVLSAPIPILGSLAAQEATDVAVIAASARHTATLAATEAADSSAFSGTASAFGILAASDAPDAINIPASVYSTATLAATEAADAAAFSASAYDTAGEIKTYFVTGRAAPSLAVTGTKQPHALTGRRRSRAAITGTMPPPAITARRNAAATWIAQQ